MNFFCIVSCAILIATANAKPSTSAPNVDEESLDYYIDSDDNSPPLDQMDDASLPPRFLMEPETITAKDGESAILRCPVENAENYGQVWLKDQNTIANGNRSMQPDLYEVFPNRTLLVKNVKPSTTGYYSCTIYISNFKKASLTHKLKLENGAEIVSLRAQNNITQLYNGDTLILTCEVDGKPLPTIKWYFESSDQPSAREVSYGNHQSNGYADTLTIPDVSFKNNGTYKCLADNTINVDHQSIVIEVFDLPIYLEIENYYGKNSKLVRLECTIKFNRSPVFHLSWRNENSLKTTQFQEKNNKSVMMHFDDIQESDFGSYICSAKSNDGVIEKVVPVFPPSTPVFEKFLVSEDQKYNISLVWKVFSFHPLNKCFVYDIVQDEYWPTSNVQIGIRNNGLDSYSVYQSQYVAFKKLFRFRITCQNAVGWSDKSEIQNFELTVDLLYIEIHRLYKDRDFIGLDCILLLNTTDVDLSWRKDNTNYEPVELNASLKRRTNNSLTLLFRENEFVGAGTYICTAKIIGSKRQLEKFIFIQPPSKPVTPIKNVTSDVKWNVYSGLSITDCKVRYGEANAFGPLEQVDTKVDIRREEYYGYLVTYRPSAFLRGSYDFVLTCKNEDGWSETSEVQTIRLGVAPVIRIEKIYSRSKMLLGFNCLVTASPIANIFWKRNGEIISSNHILRRTKNSLQIIFNDVKESDLGKYTCMAKNFVDTTEKDIMFLKPLQPQFRGFSPQGDNKGEMLMWTIFSPDPLKHCVAYYKGENETRQYIYDSKIMKIENGYLITHTPSVPHDGTYKFRIKCLSEAGWSDESQERSLGITDKGRDTATSDSQISSGLRLLPSLLLIAAAAILMNP